MSAQIYPSLRRFLVHDEVEGIDGCDYRIRVWRGVDVSPIVLVGEVEPECVPSVRTTSTAWYVTSAILRHCPEKMAYFEDETITSQILSLVNFDYAGCEQRRRPFNPHRHELPWERFEKILGMSVDR